MSNIADGCGFADCVEEHSHELTPRDAHMRWLEVVIDEQAQRYALGIENGQPYLYWEPWGEVVVRGDDYDQLVTLRKFADAIQAEYEAFRDADETIALLRSEP